jgi:hypothetical protein
VPALFEALVMPALFVGLGLLPFGWHTLHIMHLNVLDERGPHRRTLRPRVTLDDQEVRTVR